MKIHPNSTTWTAWMFPVQIVVPFTGLQKSSTTVRSIRWSLECVAWKERFSFQCLRHRQNPSNVFSLLLIAMPNHFVMISGSTIVLCPLPHLGLMRIILSTMDEDLQFSGFSGNFIIALELSWPWGHVQRAMPSCMCMSRMQHWMSVYSKMPGMIEQSWMAMLSQHHHYVPVYRHAFEILQTYDPANDVEVHLRLTPGLDHCHYNLPTADEVAVILLETTQQNPLILCFGFVLDLYIVLVTYILHIPLFNTLSFFPKVKMGGAQRWGCMRLESSEMGGFSSERDSNRGDTIADWRYSLAIYQSQDGSPWLAMSPTRFIIAVRNLIRYSMVAVFSPITLLTCLPLLTSKGCHG